MIECNNRVLSLSKKKKDLAFKWWVTKGWTDRAIVTFVLCLYFCISVLITITDY